LTERRRRQAATSDVSQIRPCCAVRTLVCQQAEHTTGTRFASGRAASAAAEAVDSPALTSGLSRRVERRHLARTAVGLADIE